MLAGAAVGGFIACSGGALAQGAPVVARPVVQALPSADTQHLNEALAKLGRDPRDVQALIDAGDAARGLGDLDAAIGFYRRADEISPSNGRVKAGLGSTYVMQGDPVSAIPNFVAAEKAGAAPAQIAGDRGLAYDLVGDNATAQRYYAAAMATGGGDEVRMRLALSQAMSGDQKAAQTTLMPLLRKQDKPGWRTRAFVLAIGGDTKQAVEITDTILPPQLAQNIAPYLRYMPRLTRAQQAAAANLGRFPRASEIGRDDPRIAAYAPPRVAAVDAGLIPKGEPLDSDRGKKNTRKSRAESASSGRSGAAMGEAFLASRAEASRKVALASADPDRVAPPEPRPTIESTGELPPIASGSAPPPVAAPTPRPATAVTPAEGMTASVPARPISRAPTPGFDLAAMPSTQPAASSPSAAPTAKPVVQGTTASSQPPAAPPEPGPAQLSLAQVFADLGKPTIQAAPASGAVDIRKIEPARPEPKAEEKPVEKEKPKKPAPPAHPSRIWVQLGVGRNKDAIAFDWRRRAKEAPALFKKRQAYVSEMGRTNRILAGPFETQQAANEFIAGLKKAGIDDALPWTSPAGQVVDPLSVD